MEKLFEIHAEDRYDLLVLDTPPSRNALDFLDAPKRLLQFIEGRALQVFMRPAGIGMKVFGRGASMMFSVLRRITGVNLLEDLAEFFQAFSGMVEGFRERARRVNELLSAPESTFLVVCGPQGEPISEAVYFHRKLVEARMPFGGVIVNKVHYDENGETAPAALVAELASELGDAGLAQRVAENFEDFGALAARDRRNVERLAKEMRTRAVIQVPYLDEDVHDLAGLMEVNRYLFASGAEERDRSPRPSEERVCGEGSSGVAPVLGRWSRCAVLAGCGGGEDTSTSATAGATGATGASGPSGPAEGTAEVPLDGPPDPGVTVAEVAEQLPFPAGVVNDARFVEDLDILVAAGHKFWSESFAATGNGIPYHTPEFIAYDGKSGDAGPDCGGEPMGNENAAYCRVPGTDTTEYGIIGWDESGLLYPLYTKLGDGSTAFIMAHEYAHLAQDRLEIIEKFPLTIEKELNADCLAGAQWTAYNSAGANFTKADIQSIIDGITIVGDAPGTKWQDAHAHGLPEERQAAFFDGYDNGVDFCLKNYRPGFSHRD